MSTTLSNDLYHLKYEIALSIRYHQRREQWLDWWDKCGKAIAVIGGTATLATAVGDGPLKLTIGLAIALTSGVSLVFGVAQKARVHNELRRKYLQLEARILKETSPTTESLAALRAEKSLIEADEPPTLSIVVRLAQNDLARSQGRLDYVKKVSLWEHTWGNLFELEIKDPTTKLGSPTP